VVIDWTDNAGMKSPDLEPLIAAACRRANVQFLCIGAARLFTARHRGAWTEIDAPDLDTPQALRQRQLEEAVLQANDHALLVRTTPVIDDGQHDKGWIPAETACTGEAETLPDLISPTYAPDLAHAALDLLIDREQGIWHLANQPPTSAAELTKLLSTAGLQSAISLASDMGASPAGFVALASIRGSLMPSLSHGLSRLGRPVCDPQFKAVVTAAEELDGALA
jgi:dTDP-4-dehydrorhamnose reductase